jgi:microcin C transport system substrate-binding protein
MAMHGDLKYGAGFSHFDYADPGALKGGTVRLSAIGTFDNLNPYILKGVGAAGLGNVFETLMKSSDDEAFSQYGLIAESVDLPQDRSWVVFTLRREARFHDNSPITAGDVVFSFNMLMEKGHPFYRSYYGSVDKVEALDDHRVKFSFVPGDNRELPLIIGNGLPILSEAYWRERDFGKTTLKAPLASGPYRVEAVDAGRSITYRRVANYWGANLAVNAGRANFDVLRYDYYRDQTVALEAFKAGAYDFRLENTSKVWATGYNFPALKRGLVIKEAIAHQQPTGMQAFAFNTRRAIFRDPQVREALGLAFDFEWTNRNLFYGAYTRSHSYFSNSELASSGLPAGEELILLEKFKDSIPQQVFGEEYTPPSTSGDGGIRGNLRKARRLLEEAGWVLKDNQLVHGESGEVMAFEILLVNPQFERIAAGYRKNLERLGVAAKLRTVDTSQYEKRIEDFDFDVVVAGFRQSLSPGNEQRDYWSSQAAETPGSRNIIGIQDPVVDELIEAVIAAPNRESLVMRTRALDRVLLWGHYLVPHWHIRSFRVAYWNMFSRPQVTPKYALGFDFWWVDPEKEAVLQRKKGAAVAADMEQEEDEPPGFTAGSLWLFLIAIAIVAFLLQRRRRIYRNDDD